MGREKEREGRKRKREREKEREKERGREKKEETESGGERRERERRRKRKSDRGRRKKGGRERMRENERDFKIKIHSVAPIYLHPSSQYCLFLQFCSPSFFSRSLAIFTRLTPACLCHRTTKHQALCPSSTPSRTQVYKANFGH